MSRDLVMILICGILFFMVLVYSSPAKSHSWYSPECCSDKECGPILKIEQDPATSGPNMRMIITTQHGTGITSPTTHWKQSKDDKDHACIRETKVICFYGAMKY